MYECTRLTNTSGSADINNYNGKRYNGYLDLLGKQVALNFCKFSSNQQEANEIQITVIINNLLWIKSRDLVTGTKT